MSAHQIESELENIDAKNITKITVAEGDGIGPDITRATLRILEAAGAQVEMDTIKVGKAVYESGVRSGISDDAWDTLRENKVLLKGPITTPQGGGYKSLNVTIRKTLGLFANVRPVKAYYPFVPTHFPDMDVVVIRENEEDLYAGIEHRQTEEVVQCLKLITRPGCERVVRYAFEYARAYNRKKVTCMTKDNIMKHTDGLFHEVFNKVAKEYTDIQAEHHIIDIGSALIANSPERFDVIVTLNLYGDIISDITAQIAGSVGLGGSANIGDGFAMFEAIHGSAPDIAGKDMANPSGMLHGACMMLVHLGQAEIAAKVQNALLKTLEDGIHTADIFNETYSKKRVGTEEFTNAIIERLGQKPLGMSIVEYGANARPIEITVPVAKKQKKELVGVDIFIDWDADDRDPNIIGKQLEELTGTVFKLKMITNRGVKVYPNGMPETFCTDHWRCRFVSVDSSVKPDRDGLVKTVVVSSEDVVDLLGNLVNGGMDAIKTENLYQFDGERAYSLGQGE